MAKKTATFEDHMSTQRERFEALIKPNQRSKFLDAHNRVTETYVESHIRGMWEGFQLGEASGMERAAAECERLSTAIDNAGKTYNRDTTSTHCALAIRALMAQGEI